MRIVYVVVSLGESVLCRGPCVLLVVLPGILVGQDRGV
jgi:hypothetical protein